MAQSHPPSDVRLRLRHLCVPAGRQIGSLGCCYLWCRSPGIRGAGHRIAHVLGNQPRLQGEHGASAPFASISVCQSPPGSL
jgi:hypothetical protein